tara:strand:+ start:1907 stop:2179 length:273 start_codon:yes stop_codon:yes gene_type:complete
MAKRKTPKAKKPTKITNEQLSKMQDLVSNVNQTQFEIGRLESQKHSMLHNVAVINDKLTLMKSEFEKEYGTSDINVQTGEIRYSNNEQTN